MITITNLSLDTATEDAAMDAITGGCYRRPRRKISRHCGWMSKKRRRHGRCYRRRVSCRPIYRPLPFPVRGVIFS